MTIVFVLVLVVSIEDENENDDEGDEMTAPNENNETNGGLKKKLAFKIFGVGNAGGSLVEQVAGESFNEVGFIAVNTDAQGLANCRIAEKFVLGSKVTRGLGAGGDPDLGRVAAKDDFEKLKSLCAGADVVFIVAGLGGGTGTGASPVLARAAREVDALVLAVVTLPFDFEGPRRMRQAQAGLRDLKAVADVVLCLPNQKVFKLIDGKTSFLETFKLTSRLVAEGVHGVWRMLAKPGLVSVDFADLSAVTKGRHWESSFVTVEATGEERAQKAIESLHTHPFLEQNQLQEATALLISVVGGADLAMSEVDEFMKAIHGQAQKADVIFGASIDKAFGKKFSVTLVVSKTDPTEQAASGVADLGGEAGGSRIPSEAETDFLHQPTPRTSSRFTAPPRQLAEEEKQQMLTRQTRPRSRKKTIGLQGQLPLEIVSRGRFEKSEPTVYEGEDLDVPTYIRRHIPLN